MNNKVQFEIARNFNTDLERFVYRRKELDEQDCRYVKIVKRDRPISNARIDNFRIVCS